MLVTRPRWPPCPHMVKTVQNLLRWNRPVDFHETYSEALGTPTNFSFSNDDPGVTLTYLTTRSSLVIKAFLWENIVSEMIILKYTNK